MYFVKVIWNRAIFSLKEEKKGYRFRAPLEDLMFYIVKLPKTKIFHNIDLIHSFTNNSIIFVYRRTKTFSPLYSVPSFRRKRKILCILGGHIIVPV